MQAIFKKVQVIPIKFDKDGDFQKEAFATLTIEIPMDSTGQREAVMELLELIRQELIYVNVYGTEQEAK